MEARPLSEALKEKIQKKLLDEKGQVEADIAGAKETLRKAVKIDESARVKSDSVATESNHDSRRELAWQRIANSEKRLRKIEMALLRLEADLYGLCKNCHEPIPLARLQAIPFTDKCLPCKEELDENDNNQRRPTKRRR